MIIFGTRLFGRVDAVPGLFHVATRFAHLWFIPIVPMQTFVVFHEGMSAWEGVPIRTSAKSVVMAWTRAILFLVMLGSVFGTLATLEKPDQWPLLFLTSVVAGALLGWTMWFRGCTRANLRRAMELAEIAGLGADQVALIERIYGGEPGRGFEVIDPLRPANAAPPVKVKPVAANAQAAEQLRAAAALTSRVRSDIKGSR